MGIANQKEEKFYFIKNSGGPDAPAITKKTKKRRQPQRGRTDERGEDVADPSQAPSLEDGKIVRKRTNGFLRDSRQARWETNSLKGKKGSIDRHNNGEIRPGGMICWTANRRQSIWGRLRATLEEALKYDPPFNNRKISTDGGWKAKG